MTDGCEVYVFEDQTVIDTADLRYVFDLVVNSMDFGSGFLDTDDVNALRRVAETLGVDPMTATPYDFRTQYAHPFEAQRPPQPNPHIGYRPSAEDLARAANRCTHCGKAPTERPHVEAPKGAAA